MEEDKLCLIHFPLDRERKELFLEKGDSSWLLGRKDKADQQFPDQPKLQELFKKMSEKGKLSVISRATNHCLISLPVGVSKEVRQRFLAEIASQIN